MKIEKLTQFKTLFPYITLWILLLSATKELVYYSGFGISILYYLELSELTYMFLDDILIWFLFFFSYVGVASLDHLDKKFKLKRIKHNSFHLYLYLLLNLILYLTVEFLEKMVNKADLYLIATIVVAFLFFLYFTALFKNTLFVKLGMIIPISFLFVFFTAKFKQEATKEGSYDMETSLSLKDKREIKSDSTSIYIGQTNNYVFFYNLNKKKHTVYFKNNISEMSFIKRH